LEGSKKRVIDIGRTFASLFSSHESGSLKMISAMALPGIPLKEVEVDEIKGESSTSRSG